MRVDRENQAVLVPIFGMVVPFHISCIKSVSATAERSGAFLRLNFYHFGAHLASPIDLRACTDCGCVVAAQGVRLAVRRRLPLRRPASCGLT